MPSQKIFSRNLITSILLYALAFLVPVSATVSVGAWLFHKQTLQRYQNIQDFLQAVFLDKVDNSFAKSKGEFAVLASNPELQNMNWPHTAPWIRELGNSHESPYEKIILAQPDGSYWTHKPGNPSLGDLQTENNQDPHAKPLNLSTREYWKTYIAQDNPNSCFVSEPVISLSTKVRQWVIGCRVSTPDRQFGMIAGTIDWKHFNQNIKEIKNLLELNHQLYPKISVVNSQNHFVFSEDTNLLIHIQSGKIIKSATNLHAPQSHSWKWLTSTRDSSEFKIFIPSLGGYAIVKIAQEELLGQLKEQFLFAVLAIAISVMAALIFHALNLFRARNYLSLLYTASHNLLAGRKPNLKPDFFPKGEWRTVALAFQNTAEQLLEREQDLLTNQENLEKEVIRRTEIAISSKAESNRLQIILEQIPVSVLITDTSKKIVFANQFFSQSTGFPLDFCIGKTPRILKSGKHDAEIYEQMWATLATKQSWRGILCNRKKDGTMYWAQTTILPYVDDTGNTTHYVAVHEDITELKEHEEALRQTTIQAQIAAETKAEFLSVMSHEIRTPLNAVVGFSQLLQIENHLPSQADSLQSLERSARHLLGLVNDILDFSKIEAGKLELCDEVFDLRMLCKDSLQMFNSIAQEKSIGLAMVIDESCPVWVHGDSLRLGQVLVNLISNAVKFTSQGQVSLGIEILSHSPESYRAKFKISDTGIGIDPEQAQRLFQPFAQANSSISRKYGGTGLGLVISQKIIELHSSTLQLTSTPGIGSTFFFELDLRPSAAPTTKSISELYQNKWPGRKILLVDDNSINLKIGRKFLELWSLDVFTARSGAEAIEQVGTESFDLILMDLQMPEQDGFECSAAILALHPHQNIVALTAEVGDDLDDRIQNSGMKGLVSKPFRPESLQGILAKFLG